MFCLKSIVYHQLRNQSLLCSEYLGSRKISFSAPVTFSLTSYLLAEPLKKKKRIDPAVIKAREDRKRKKIEKEIRLLQKLDKCLKPIEENQIPHDLYEEKDSRKREINVPDHVTEGRISLLKEWSRIRRQCAKFDFLEIKKLIQSQQRALNELKKESEILYHAAVQTDENLIPFVYKGPVETPPLKGYQCPDGDYINISKTW